MALQVTGPDHVLFGTDLPAAPEPTVVHNIENLSFDGVTAAELAGADRENAARLFRRFAPRSAPEGGNG
ncbi:amidohydrolase family protein [Pseudonocardia nigra]|uniref:amidohydrolase family protein n=1 Tax=Pseudonocardia nigra TaxID=1921578 RepID=UPI001C5E3512|nr:amidohydrolase family protein [Pseudonocardia nigra]